MHNGSHLNGNARLRHANSGRLKSRRKIRRVVDCHCRRSVTPRFVKSQINPRVFRFVYMFHSDNITSGLLRPLEAMEIRAREK